MGMSATSHLGEALVEIINEAVESAINETDFESKILDALPNFDDLVEEAVDKIDLDDKVSEAVDNYDFSEIVEKEVEKELEGNLGEYVQNEMAEYVKSNQFKELVAAQVAEVLKKCSLHLCPPMGVEVASEVG
jgi:hypothetical protein